MNILTIVGARPQFIKSSPVSQALKKVGHQEYLVHTGQHYDYGMSQIFFDELNIAQPNINLNIGSGSHGHQTAQMLIRLEDVIKEQKPQCVLVYGDTNSTLSGALAAVKLHVPVAHVEAGLRSFNREMPEEHNRVLTDHCSDLLLCPTQTAVNNLANEGITHNVYMVGDTMYDAMLQFSGIADKHSTILQNLGLEKKKYLLVTVHRPYNTDNLENLRNILAALMECEERIIFPIHPRTQARMKETDFFKSVLNSKHLHLLDPVGYLDMLTLEQHSRIIITDSGGIQKEAYFFGVPCVTLRPETEWIELVEVGWNIVTGADKNKILAAISTHVWPRSKRPPLFGNGNASMQIANLLFQMV